MKFIFCLFLTFAVLSIAQCCVKTLAKEESKNEKIENEDVLINAEEANSFLNEGNNRAQDKKWYEGTLEWLVEAEREMFEWFLPKQPRSRTEF